MFKKYLVALAAAIAATLVSVAPAVADGTTTSEVKAGNKGETVGGSIFTITTDEAGDQTLQVTTEVHPSYLISSVIICVSDEPFVERVNPAQCEGPLYNESVDPNAATHTAVIALGTQFVDDDVVYVQAHINVTHQETGEQETAFAGWQPGSGRTAFYGNVAADNSEAGPAPAVPEVSATVLLPLVGLVIGAAAYGYSRRRHQTIAA